MKRLTSTIVELTNDELKFVAVYDRKLDCGLSQVPALDAALDELRLRQCDLDPEFVEWLVA